MPGRTAGVVPHDDDGDGGEDGGKSPKRSRRGSIAVHKRVEVLDPKRGRAIGITMARFKVRSDQNGAWSGNWEGPVAPGLFADSAGSDPFPPLFPRHCCTHYPQSHTPTQMRDAILNFDEAVLEGGGLVSLLLTCVPDDDECRKLSEYTGDPADLAPPEQLLREIMHIPMLERRLRVRACLLVAPICVCVCVLMCADVYVCVC